MPSYDFWCEQHGKTEGLFCKTGQRFYPCRICGKPAEQRWLKCPNVDRAAFAAWGGIHDPNVGVFSDKGRYLHALKEKGSRIYEPGMDREAEDNNKRHIEKAEEKFKDKIGAWMGSHTLDEVRGMVKAEAKLHEAQRKGDRETIRNMGAFASLEDAFDAAPKTPVVEYEKVK